MSYSTELEISFLNSILYGKGVMISYGKASSQYSFGLWYFDDWRCVAEYLRRGKYKARDLQWSAEEIEKMSARKAEPLELNKIKG